MLVSLNPQRLSDIIAGYAKEKDKYVLYINMSTWLALDATKKATVKTFYEFGSESQATDKAQDWFPISTSLTDQDYFIECQVITPSGSISYTNKTTSNPN